MSFKNRAISTVSALFTGLILIQTGMSTQTSASSGVFSVTAFGLNPPPGSQSDGFQVTSIAAGKAAGVWIDDVGNSHAAIFDIAAGQWTPLPGRGSSSAALATDGTYYVGYEVLPGVVPAFPSQAHCAVWTPTASGFQEQLDPLNTFAGRSLDLLAQSWCTSIDNGNVGGTAYDQVDVQLHPEDAQKLITQYENGFLSFASPIAVTVLGDPVCCSILRASRNGQQAGQVSFVPPMFSGFSADRRYECR